MTSAELYNGWSNRETWNANLWLANEEVLYRQVCNLQKFYWSRETPDDVLKFANALKDFCADLWPLGATPDDDDLSEVDWAEIARSWVSE